ncbi:efflux RND transporter periplasmic adaptor subunit [Streptococcus massiliensis]|uniref:Efflux transporter n=1 Tax=Streptococcus massiliensis TaxID=313439 RepID=A0A380KWA0_9STRE|nr:efflux RND transporter periplasmic adaptor subunit [Streptococcus massiliensis]SUN76202.1 efflux transporter [Streptococcus massiliensis]
MKKLKKWQWISMIAGAVVVVVGGGYLLFGGGNSSSSQTETSLETVTPKEGSVASSVLLSGNVVSSGEQFVYYDATKGTLDSVLVNVGDQVTVGQTLVQYSSRDAQDAYDKASRALNKIDRQIYNLKTYGTTVDLTGDEETDNKNIASTQRTVDEQLRELQDNRADAEAEVNKAQAVLNETAVTATTAGTVVEVNRDVSKSTTGSNQTLVHVVSNGNLQIKGELSEYNLANLSVGQEVTIGSKVYPDKKWTGKISYISNYPKDSQSSAAGTGASADSGVKYPFTVDFTSEIGDLKQGFKVNMEVKNNSKSLLVPVSSIVADGEKSYVWVDDKGKAKKIEVTLGNADAENQEVKTGLTKDAKVITNPTTDMKEGQEVKADAATH